MTIDVKWYLVAIVCLLLPARSLSAQYGEIPVQPEISFGVEVQGATRYVWRGLDLSNDVNLQPSLWVSNGALEVGTWGSHALDGGYHEQDFWLAYNLARGPGGNMLLTLTDYYANPEFGKDFFNFKGAGNCAEGEDGFGRLPRCAHGAHTIEMALSYSGQRSPFDLRAAYNFHNDPEDAVYLEGRIRPVVAGFELGLAAGGVVVERVVLQD